MTLQLPHPGMYYYPMKFERWNKDTNQFEVVKMSPEEYDELLLGFAIVQAEVEIESRIEDLNTLGLKDRELIIHILEKYPNYD